MTSLKRRPLFPAGLLVLAIALFAELQFPNPSLAHHTYVTRYNPEKLTTLRGVISSVDFRNPHIFFYIDVTYKNGSTITWRIETESIAKARARGLTQNVLRQGAKAVVTGWPSREGAAEMGLKSISVGGRKISMRRTAR